MELVSRTALRAAGFGVAAAATGLAVYWPESAWARDATSNPAAPTHGRLPTRAEQLASLRAGGVAAPFDVLIIGGGATGTGCAVDAVSRGLKTALVEREDFASGTSSRSTKLIHGGVRYLEKAVFGLDYSQLKLVFEALFERRTMLDIAPHLTNELPIAMPCYKWWEIPFFWAGLKAYDVLATTRALTWSYFVTASESRRRFPTLAEENAAGHKLLGSVIYYDGQFDDARMNVTLACTAAEKGATVLNHANVKGLIKGEDGKVRGAVVEDRLTGKSTEVYAKVVVNCSGPFTDSVRKLLDTEASKSVQPSSGVHLTLPAFYSPATMGMIVPKTKDGRVVFLLPWKGSTIAGTTDSPAEAEMRPRAKKEDVAFILEAISDFLDVPVRPSDVQSAWSGIRPLAFDPTKENTESAVRDHLVYEEDGLITVTGGKWTTYRLMAEHAVDAAVRSAGLDAGACVTADLPLLGATAYHPGLHAQLSSNYTVPHRKGYIAPDVAKHLTHAYGDRAPEVTQIAQERGLGRRLVPWHTVLEAEVPYVVANEYCLTAVDFLAHRTRLAFLDVNACYQALPRVVELMGKELGWSRSRQAAEMKDAKAFLATFDPEQCG